MAWHEKEEALGLEPWGAHETAWVKELSACNLLSTGPSSLHMRCFLWRLTCRIRSRLSASLSTPPGPPAAGAPLPTFDRLRPSPDMDTAQKGQRRSESRGAAPGAEAAAPLGDPARACLLKRY